MNPYRKNSYIENDNIKIKDIVHELCKTHVKEFQFSISENISYCPSNRCEISIDEISTTYIKVKLLFYNESWVHHVFRVDLEKDSQTFYRLKEKSIEVSSYYKQKLLNKVFKEIVT